MKVFINPGHYPGKDSGAVGYGLNECDVVLKIGKQVDNIATAYSKFAQRLIFGAQIYLFLFTPTPPKVILPTVLNHSPIMILSRD